jgi:hypothetical protein
MVFAREISGPLTSLVKKVDATKGIESFVVFCNDSEGLEKDLKKLADKESLKTTILTVGPPAGPSAYKVAKEADVTVVLYTNRNVKANHTFKKGEFNAAAVDRIVADIPKILPEKK